MEQFAGYPQEETIKKLAAMIVYLASKTNGEFRGRTKLTKHLLFADIAAFKKYERSISGDLYVREQAGPIPSHFYEALDYARDTGFLMEDSDQVEVSGLGSRLRYRLTVSSLGAEQANACLSDGEKSIIDAVFAEFSDMTTTELVDKAHSLPAWNYSEPGEPLSIPELSIESEEEYWEFVELVEDLEDNDTSAMEALNDLLKD